MGKMLKISFLLCLMSVNSFAYVSYDPYLCALQNLFNHDSCRPNVVRNDEYGCWALPYTRVNGEPVCVDQ